MAIPCSAAVAIALGIARKERFWLAEEEITEFLEPLLARLSEVLGRCSSVESQLSALGAVSSAAAAAGSGFKPYAAAVLPLLMSYMRVTEARPILSAHVPC
jgi:hypothetical protein